MKVAIIGAGVLGRLTALQLIQQQAEISIFDQGSLTDPDNAASTSAGMLCPLGEIIHAPKVVTDMGWWSLEHWPLDLSLATEFDPEHEPIFFQQQGSIALAFPQDKACFDQLQQDISHKVADAHALDWLNAEQLHALEPALHQFDKGVHLKSEGQLCNRTFLRVTDRALKAHTQVFERQRIDATRLTTLQQSFDVVIDCRGSGAIREPFVSAQPLRGVRGEVIRVQCEEVTLNRPLRVMHPRNSIYIVPKPNHEFVIGATEIETQSEHPITVKSSLELLSTLYCVHPAFGEARIVETNVGIRTAYADNIASVHREGNLICANGCYRHGWLIGPAMVDKIMTTLQELA